MVRLVFLALTVFASKVLFAGEYETVNSLDKSSLSE